MSKKKTTKKSEEKTSDKELTDEIASLLIMESPPRENKVRFVNLYGSIDEEKAEEACLSLLALKETGQRVFYEEPNNPESAISTIEYDPIDVFISTWGGSAVDMFAIYDTMRLVREECTLHTIGMGKVMSAGVLLLAGGSKGHRTIGKNCRVMMHSVIGGHHGAIHSLENEMEEIRWIQKTHIDALVEETNMTKRYLNKLLDRKVNAYIGAKEAIELGIADIII